MMRLREVSIVGGPSAGLAMFLLLPEHYAISSIEIVALNVDARLTLAMTTWMALWWLTEAVDVVVTALLPIALFPLFGLNSIKIVSSAYAHPLTFLFFGGFLISIAIEKWRLHVWMATHVVARAGDSACRLVGGLMLISAFASMWLSNTATAIMMLPIALSLIADMDKRMAKDSADNFARCVLLGVAYAASIGGTATLIGSPPNLFVASFLVERFGIEVDFRQWMVLALPVSVVMLPLSWFVLTRYIAPVSHLRQRVGSSPTDTVAWSDLQPGARRVALVFFLSVVAWLSRSWLTGIDFNGLAPFAGLTDTGIAMLAGIALFLIPAGAAQDVNRRLLTWSDTSKLPFGTLILFGGGLALAATVSATGADKFLGAQLVSLRDVPLWMTLGTIVATVVFLTELTSNTATTTTLAPILAAAAVALDLDPFALVVVTALAASCAFMMPVATPPNAIVFSSGRISVVAMARAGIFINLIAILVITALALYWLPLTAASGMLS